MADVRIAIECGFEATEADGSFVPLLWGPVLFGHVGIDDLCKRQGVRLRA